MTRGLRAFEFEYKGAGYGARVQKVIEDWKELYESGPGSFSDEVTKEYMEWRERRINDMVMTVSQEAAQSTCFPPRMIISEVDIVKQELATKEKAWEREKTTLVEEATFSKYDVMKKETELELKTKELGIVKGDLENSKSLIKELETQVRFEAKGIKTSRKWKEENDQLMRSKESWKEKALQKREEAERISQELQGSEGKRKTLETRVKECEAENTKLRKLLEDDQKEIGRLVQERDMWKSVHAIVLNDLKEFQKNNEILKTLLNTNELYQRYLEVIDALHKQREEIIVMDVEHDMEKRAWQLKESSATAAILGRHFYIHHLATQLCKAVRKARELLDQAKELKRELIPTTTHGQHLLNFLDEIMNVSQQVSCFYGFNPRMIENVQNDE